MNASNPQARTLRGGLVVVSGPSGSGKTTICSRLRRDDRVRMSVSATTRAKRPGEVDGEDYHFFDRARFEEAIRGGEFVEWAEVYGNLYGSLRQPLVEALPWKDRIYLMEIDVQGAKQLRDEGHTGTFILVLPPSLEVLRERLVGRGTDSPEAVERRLGQAAVEMEARDRYDHVVTNNDLDRATREVQEILGLV